MALAQSVTDGGFRDYFSQYGAVVDATIMYDDRTKRSRGVSVRHPDVVGGYRNLCMPPLFQATALVAHRLNGRTCDHCAVRIHHVR